MKLIFKELVLIIMFWFVMQQTGIFIMVAHVNDIIITWSDVGGISQVKPWLESKFHTKELSILSITLPLRLLNHMKAISHSQKKQVFDLLTNTSMSDCRLQRSYY